MSSRERMMRTLNMEMPDRVPWMESAVGKDISDAIVGRVLPDPSPARFPLEVLDVLSIDNISLDLRAPEFCERITVGGVPMVGRGLLTGWDQIDMLDQLPDPHDERLYQPIKDYLKKYKGDRAAMVVIRGGPSNAYLSLGIQEFSLMLYDDPKFVTHVVDAFASWYEAVAEHLSEIEEVDLIRLNEDLAYKTAPLFSPKVIREYLMPAIQRVVDKIKKPWIFHTDGNVMLVLEDILKLGPCGLCNIEPGAMDIEQIKRDYGQRICLIGNIDLGYTLTEGTPKEVEQEVKERIEIVGQGGGYILSSSNIITNYCKVENVLAMNKTLEKYGYYS